MNPEEVLQELKSMSNSENILGMARFGIRPARPLGISMPVLRKLGSRIPKDHTLAAQLWKSGFHEARILASIVDEAEKVDDKQMDLWAEDFDSWDICDQCCLNLFVRTPYVFSKAHDWILRQEEFIRRAGYVLVASAAVHCKTASDGQFIELFPVLETGMQDNRNFVKKAVSWAFRQVGKRNRYLNNSVISFISPFVDSPDRSSRWIAKDVVKELQSPDVQSRFTY